MLRAGKRKENVITYRKKKRREYLEYAYKVLLSRVEQATKDGKLYAFLNTTRLTNLSGGIIDPQLVDSDVFPRLLAYYFHKKHPSYQVQLVAMGEINWLDGGWIYVYWDGEQRLPFNTHWYPSKGSTETSTAQEINEAFYEATKDVITEADVRRDILQLIETLKKYENKGEKEIELLKVLTDYEI